MGPFGLRWLLGRFGGRPIEPPDLTELSEKEVMNVLAIMRKEFNIETAQIVPGHHLAAVISSNWPLEQLNGLGVEMDIIRSRCRRIS